MQAPSSGKSKQKETKETLQLLPRHQARDICGSIPAAYLAACLIIVQVHESAGILLDLSGIHKDLGEADAVADVSRAATPLPALVPVVLALLLLVAAAVAQVALGTGSCDGMGHAGCDDGVCEGSLPAPCERREGYRVQSAIARPG